MSVLDPDVEGGRDFATTVIGDAWDLTNVQDVQRNNASLHHLTSATFDEAGLLGVTRGGSYASGCAADTCPDPFVQFLDDGFGFGPPVIDANTYHRLSFTLDYDHHELMIGQAISNFWGGVARVAWAASDGTGYTPYHHHAGHGRHRRRPDPLPDGPVDVRRHQHARGASRHAVAGRGRHLPHRHQRERSGACLPPLQRQARRRRRAERQRLLPDPLADRRRHLYGRRRRQRRRRRHRGVLLRHRSEPGDEDADRVGHQRRERPLLLEHGRPRARRLLRLRRRHRWHRQLAGPLLDRPGPRQRGDSRPPPTATATASPTPGRRSTACRIPARTTTATAGPTWPSTRPGRIRACRTAGRWRKARPASSPNAWRWPTPIRRRRTSRSPSCGRRRTRRSRGPTRCCRTGARPSTSTRWPAWASPTCPR